MPTPSAHLIPSHPRSLSLPTSYNVSFLLCVIRFMPMVIYPPRPTINAISCPILPKSFTFPILFSLIVSSTRIIVAQRKIMWKASQKFAIKFETRGAIAALSTSCSALSERLLIWSRTSGGSRFRGMRYWVSRNSEHRLIGP